MVSATAFVTRFTESVPRGPGTMSFRFEKPEGFEYQAGQYFILTLPGRDGSLKKPFTFSSAPTEPFLELTTRMSGSEFKNALATLLPGAEVEMRAPNGSFVLKDGVARMACVIGGVGITPFRSMVRSLADLGVCDREIVLLYGNSSEEGITFGEELDHIARRLPQVRVVNVLSRPGDSWRGRRGHLNVDVIREELELPGEWTYYLCGPPPLMEGMVEALAELGVPDEHVVLERFGPPARK